ncbi:MAG: multidrug efflux RND transporter permease subunit, partial [Gammaproteobacteria bacterium]|nr:multidrug efflux RND transporter permease subunit [Gammaproteobacteria bacterium]
ILITFAGILALRALPVSQYPSVAPPALDIAVTYPGASAQVVEQSAVQLIEQEMNGVENLLYMDSSSQAGSGQVTLTFRPGTDIQFASVEAQNRIKRVEARLPDDVRRLGVATEKSSPDLTMVVHLVSTDGRYDPIYLSNYAVLQIKDTLARIPGMGQVLVFGAGEYSMRVWLDPEKIAARNLTAADVVRAIREQNVQVAAGSVGQTPTQSDHALQLTVNAQGRLNNEDEFGRIVIKTGAEGQSTLLKDVARIEMGAESYALRSLLDNKAAAAIPIFQAPGSNALALSNNVRAAMIELKKNFPEGIDYKIVYDPTLFVRDSIKAVVTTLLEAVLLVVLVVILFLQTWRASIIPLVAVPVSIVGTFAVLLALGYSINALSLFGLVLAIGIVVDDAIVVVENVERHIANGLSPRDATKRAMNEVTGPIIATALVLCAVFIPTAFISGLTGQFFKQFAITIAISTVISAINSLTLSPALAAVLLRPHDAPKDAFTRVLDRLLGGVFRPFNRVFDRSAHGYVNVVRKALRGSGIALAVYAGLIGLTYLGFSKVPEGFVPTQDKMYLVSFAQLPDGATLDRTDAVIRRISDIAMKTPGVDSAVAFPGLSINGFTSSSNAGVVFITLKPYAERTTPDLSMFAIAGKINQQLGGIKEAFSAVFPPPPVMGLGTLGGFKLQLEDRADLGLRTLSEVKDKVMMAAYQTPQLAGVFSGFQANVPQLSVEVDREKAKQQGVALTDVYDTMQIYLGSLYVNDFNRFGRTYPVTAQADAPYRLAAADIGRLKTRNAQGDMVPLSALISITETAGPDRVFRYNGYPSADINGGPAPGVSSGQAQAIIDGILKNELPQGMKYEWTDLTFQQILAGNTAVYIFPLCVLFVFLVLAAQYESWSLPVAVILIVPTVLLSAITGVWLTGGDNNIFTQIGLIVLVGLASKNAILIVEFAKNKQEQGMDRMQAVLEACRLRLRPILMTSIAFIMGVVPLVLASGAGAEMRHAMGIAVFSGMIGVTFFGLLLTPVFYVGIRKLIEEKLSGRTATPPLPAAVNAGGQ